MRDNRIPIAVIVTALLTVPVTVRSGASSATSLPAANDDRADSPDAVLSRIRSHIQQLLDIPQPELYRRHLQSVLTLCEDEVLKLRFASADREAKTKESLGYLEVIESGLNGVDTQKPEAYLVDGRRSLILARASRSDGTLQFCIVSLPAHWDPNKTYGLSVLLHGRESDLPLSLAASSFKTQSDVQKPNDNVIAVVPWLRGNGEWRDQNGSEPDVWEAIDDVKTFAKVDPDRQYISGHSWGGDDVWAIVLRTPDLWAAAGIMAGSADSVPPEFDLVANAQHIPFYLWKGEKDPIPNRQAHLQHFRDSLTQVGDPPKVVIAQGVGHNPRPEDYAAMRSWLLEHVRHRPTHFSFAVDTPQHRGIWGISIPKKYPDAYSNAEPKASFKCWIEGSTVRIETANADHLDADLGPQGLGMSGNVTVTVNGKQVFQGAVPTKALSLTF